jgi:hypothetical protein
VPDFVARYKGAAENAINAGKKYHAQANGSIFKRAAKSAGSDSTKKQKTLK